MSAVAAARYQSRKAAPTSTRYGGGTGGASAHLFCRGPPRVGGVSGGRGRGRQCRCERRRDAARLMCRWFIKGRLASARAPRDVAARCRTDATAAPTKEAHGAARHRRSDGIIDGRGRHGGPSASSRPRPPFQCGGRARARQCWKSTAASASTRAWGLSRPPCLPSGFGPVDAACHYRSILRGLAGCSLTSSFLAFFFSFLRLISARSFSVLLRLLCLWAAMSGRATAGRRGFGAARFQSSTDCTGLNASSSSSSVARGRGFAVSDAACDVRGSVARGRRPWSRRRGRRAPGLGAAWARSAASPAFWRRRRADEGSRVPSPAAPSSYARAREYLPPSIGFEPVIVAHRLRSRRSAPRPCRHPRTRPVLLRRRQGPGPPLNDLRRGYSGGGAPLSGRASSIGCTAPTCWRGSSHELRQPRRRLRILLVGLETRCAFFSGLLGASSTRQRCSRQPRRSLRAVAMTVHRHQRLPLDAAFAQCRGCTLLCHLRTSPPRARSRRVLAGGVYRSNRTRGPRAV